VWINLLAVDQGFLLFVNIRQRLSLSTDYPQFFHMVFQIIIRSLVLKNLADKAFVCYDSNIPAN